MAPLYWTAYGIASRTLPGLAVTPVYCPSSPLLSSLGKQVSISRSLPGEYFSNSFLKTRFFYHQQKTAPAAATGPSTRMSTKKETPEALRRKASGVFCFLRPSLFLPQCLPSVYQRQNPKVLKALRCKGFWVFPLLRIRGDNAALNRNFFALLIAYILIICRIMELLRKMENLNEEEILP